MSKLSGVLALSLAAMVSLSSIMVRAADGTNDPVDALSVPQPGATAPWPVQVTDNGRTFLIYQPQVDKWENNRLEGRSAVSVRNDASGQQNFGVAYFSARTELDQGSGTVTVRDAVVGKADFPALATGAGADDYLPLLRAQFASRSWQVAQDRLQSDMEIDKYARQSAQQPLRNDPPRILFSERPAVLVPIDGNPVLRPVAGTGIMRVTNTRALILQDKAASRYYLYVSDHWMESQGLAGPWSVAVNPSAQLEQARQIATQQDQVDLLEADAGDGAAMPASVAVFVSTTPTELLQTDGAAQYAPIAGTQLLYVTNSPNKLFLDLRTQNHYALISGRWYRTTALTQGQWNFVPASSLPGDFALIPDGNPTESVRAAVPGTPQAREAVIANSVPQMATVVRDTVQPNVTYDGNPAFQPIEGTSLQNAVNSPLPVIRVGEESFYALDNGVWFAASSPFGPWTVASFVPPAIYSIPPSSPLYYATYVRVYDATPEAVYVGYTPGYVGSYLSSDSVVVYGTGWPYRSWIGSDWYGAPVTWGFGFSFMHSWWHPYPWYYGHRAAWASPRPYYHPWWGPWHAPVHGRGGFVAGNVRGMPGVHNVGRIYDRWDRRSVAWNGPRAISNQQRPAMPSLTRPGLSNGFAAGSDSRWRDDRSHDRGARDAQQFRGNAANSSAMRTPPAVQMPWRRQQFANRDDRGRVQSAPQRIQPPSFGGNDRRQVQGDGRPVFDRPRANVQQQRPAPPTQAPQRMPPVAGVPVARSPSQPQRAWSQSRSYSAPVMTNPGRAERPAFASTGRGMERPSMNPGHNVERSAGRSQSRGAEPRRNSGGGSGNGHRFGAH